jgi:hypothetical protein
MPTATSTQPCQYGYVAGTTVGTNNSPVANLNNTLFGTMTFTPTELDSLISSGLYTKDYPFLGDYPDKGDVMTNWPYINPAVIARGIPDQAFDLHCMKKCTGSDGGVYEQPHSAYSEVTDALYLMFDFEQELPLNMIFNGNIGARDVVTKTNATGFMTLAHTAVTPAYNPIPIPAPWSPRRRAASLGAIPGLAAGANLNLAHARDGAPLLPGQGDVAPARFSAALGNMHHRRRKLPTSMGHPTIRTPVRRVGNPGLKPFKATTKPRSSGIPRI